MPKSIFQWGVRIVHRIQVVWWFLTRPNTRGVKCILLNNEKVLLVRLSYGHRKWSIPGGGVHKNEQWTDAAIRELREETGIMIDVSQVNFLTTYQQHIEYKSDTVQCFFAHTTNSDYKIDNREISEAGWFALDDLPPNRTQNVDVMLNMMQNQQSVAKVKK